MVISNSSVEDVAFWVDTEVLAINITFVPVGYDELIVDGHEDAHAVGQSVVL